MAVDKKPRDRTSPRNRVSAITLASYRNIYEETRFLDPRDRPLKSAASLS
ncbi:hypothetical protein [Microcoleus sp.]